MGNLVIPCDPGQVSDGYHTFDELYEHRCTMFVLLMHSMDCQRQAWRSYLHDDGTKLDGWFICGISLLNGMITYHLPIHMWWLLDHDNIITLPKAPKWDGHTAKDVLDRMRQESADIVSRAHRGRK